MFGPPVEPSNHQYVATGQDNDFVFATTMGQGELVASERRAAERVGELQLVRFSPAHRWYYFSAMQRDEVLLLKTFDSATDGVARRVVHSAFDNPLAPADAPARESIESRLLVFYPD